ncbi:phosphoglycerate dehydrogenase (plasmid) [Tundrisphaera lichenicola]|uniref:phosphoglycerate dehydrogenase n=1 Tax=Tundrisphaera lichenicola TaxID=2029860 RepID=UPI003EBBF9D8
MNKTSPRRVLVTNLIMQRDAHQFADQLRAAGVELEMYPVRQFLTEDELLPILGGFDGMIAGDDQLTARVLEASLPRLRVISKWGVGLDSIDLEAARRLDIRVYNSPGAFGDAVGETALGYLLMLARHLGRVDRAVRRGEWPKPEGEGLGGKVLGIIGFGAIGQAIARRALAFDMTVLACDVRAAELALTTPPGTRFADLDRVVETADYLCLACNLTAENRHLIDAGALATMKPTSYLVNVARGPLVDESALVEALLAGRIAGAALDVFETEPVTADNPLARLENVVLGSHNANNLKSANDYVNRNTIANLLEGLTTITS